MATIVNTPGTTSDSAGANGLVIGLVLIIALAILFWFLGAPYMRGGTDDGTPATNVENNVQAPSAPTQAPAEGGDSSINVPDKIDVNVKTDQGGQ